MYSRMAKQWVRACGVLVLLAGAWVLLNVPSPRECHPDPLPPHAGLRLAAFAAAFAVASSSLGWWLMASPLRGVPSPWALINLAIGAGLIFSAAVVIRQWPLLSWGRRRLR